MINFYVYKIKSGEIELGDVPMLWRLMVEKALKNNSA